jgi:impB/mucB/samB family protein
VAADRRGEQRSGAAPSACFACVRLGDVSGDSAGDSGALAAWQPVMRACMRLTPLIEEHPEHHILLLALGGSERLLLGHTAMSGTGEAPEREGVKHTWLLLAEALIRQLTELAAQTTKTLRLTVGIGPTRTLAWMAALSATAEAPAVVLPGQERPFLAPLPLAMMGQVPDALAVTSLAQMLAALEVSGIRTLGQLWRLPTESLARRFGADGAALAALAVGGDLRPLRPREHEQWLGARLRFEPTLAAQHLPMALAPLAERLALTLAERDLAAGTIALLLESETGGQLHSVRRLAHPLATTHALLDAANRLLVGLFGRPLADAPLAHQGVAQGQFYQPDVQLPAEGERYVTLRLRLGGLHPATAEQRRLWAAEQEHAGVERIERLTAALGALRGGRYADALLRADLHTPDAILPEERYRMLRRSPEASDDGERGVRPPGRG